MAHTEYPIRSPSFCCRAIRGERRRRRFRSLPRHRRQQVFRRILLRRRFQYHSLTNPRTVSRGRAKRCLSAVPTSFHLNYSLYPVLSRFRQPEDLPKIRSGTADKPCRGLACLPRAGPRFRLSLIFALSSRISDTVCFRERATPAVGIPRRLSAGVGMNGDSRASVTRSASQWLINAGRDCKKCLSVQTLDLAKPGGRSLRQIEYLGDDCPFSRPSGYVRYRTPRTRLQEKNRFRQSEIVHEVCRKQNNIKRTYS